MCRNATQLRKQSVKLNSTAHTDLPACRVFKTTSVCHVNTLNIIKICIYIAIAEFNLVVETLIHELNLKMLIQFQIMIPP